MFNFGSSKSRSSSSSLDFGVQGSSSFSDSLARSLSESQGSSFSTQSVFQSDILRKLYGDAIGAADRTDTGLFSGQAAQLFSGGTGILDQLGVGAGADYLSSRVAGESPVLGEQIGALSEDVGRFFREELNPAITSRGVATGTLGGGRQGVAQGKAAEVAGREFQRGATELRSRDMAARDAAAAQLMAGQTQAAGVGLNAIPGLLATAQAGLGAELSPYTALAGIIGGPTVLTEAGSQDFATASSEQVARAISEAFGFNYGTSQSSSKSGSFSFGF